MTTNHHTPIAFGANADADVFNPPLGELDSALSDSLAGIEAFSALLVGSGTLDASALLTLNSTTKGFLPPRMTTAQRDAIVSPAEGLLIHNTSNNEPNIYKSFWDAFGGDSALFEIEPTTTVVTSTSFTLNNIPQTYQDLLLRLRFRQTSVEPIDPIYLRFNTINSAGAYAWQQYYGLTGTINNANSASDSKIEILGPTNIAASNRYADIAIYIRNYTEVTELIVGDYKGCTANNSGIFATWGALQWLNGGAITRIDVSSPLQTINGSFALYGIGQAE